MIGLLDEIINPVKDWFDMFLTETAAALRSSHPYLDNLVSDGVINIKGKHMRPILTMLVSKAYGRNDLENIISSAVSVELVHIASLIHDDILDEAGMRHNVPTANMVVGPHAAVLAGDYVLSKGVFYPISKGNIRAVNLLVDTMEQLVEGELRQKSYSDNLDIDKEGYFKVISLKTSCLISVAARLGAPKEYDDLMAALGKNIGAAFQIKDDMLDIWNTKTGKSLYNDFKEKKITLPLILAMEGRSEVEKQVHELISSEVTDSVALQLADIVKTSDSFEKLNKILEDLEAKSIAIVDQMPKSDATEALYKFVKFVTRREL